MLIVTCGDSWSRGEWNNDGKSHSVSHNGINKYFKDDGHQVVNIHKFSNEQAINALQDYLKNNSPDIIFYFFTDPFRDVLKKDNSGTIIEFPTNIVSFQELHQRLMLRSLKKLDRLGKKIYVLGGCQRVFPKEFKHIKILIKSISELICPEYKHPLYWDSGWTSFIPFTKRKFDKNFFYFLEYYHKQQWAMTNDEYAEFFRPDGFHPNRKSHFTLYNYLKENVDEFK